MGSFVGNCRQHKDFLSNMASRAFRQEYTARALALNVLEFMSGLSVWVGRIWLTWATDSPESNPALERKPARSHYVWKVGADNPPCILEERVCPR
jgi:hypothetical protein